MGDYEDTLTRLGFVKDPFQHKLGEKMPENLLEEMWVNFPGVERIMDLEQSSVLLAKPGSGKTTWRRYVEKTINRQSDGKYLVVVYNRFQLPANSTVTLKDHRDPLLGQIARTVYDFLTKDNQSQQNIAHPDLATIQPNWRNWWAAFLAYYLPGSKRSKLTKLFLSDSNPTSDLPKWHNSDDLRDFLLDELLPALAILGIIRLYVLLDDLDGLPETQDQTILSSLIEPLINTNLMLSDDRLVWKFFVPDSIKNVIWKSSGYQTGRLEPLSIQWDQDTLAELLKLRLKHASKGTSDSTETSHFIGENKQHESREKSEKSKPPPRKEPVIIESIDQLLAADALQISPSIADELYRMALEARRLGPPRTLLQHGKLLFNQIAGNLITKKDWDEFLKQVYEELETDELEIDKEDNAMLGQINHIELREILESRFSSEYLRVVCFDLRIPYSNLKGGTHQGKVISFVEHLQQHNRLADFTAYLKEKRPDMWKTIIGSPEENNV